ncbi:MAG: hypothetical protein AB1465_06835 [Patescibacteria group bacterium]
MKILSLEKSKEITTQFLKHFEVYNKKGVDEYFKSSPPKPTESHSGCFGCLWGIGMFFRFIHKFLTNPPPIKKNIYSDIDFEKYYDEHFYSSKYTFEDEEKRFGQFCKALEKTFEENNISVLYAIESDPERLCYTKRLKDTLDAKMAMSLSLKDIVNRIGIGSADKFIFPINFSFLLSTDTDGAISIFGSEKIISDFKKNYPEYCRDFTL